MHLLVRESAGLDDTAPAADLDLAPADLIMLSFSDSDLTTAASAWLNWDAPRPNMRLAQLARLRHPMSVDLFCDKSLAGTKAVLVRLLGGLDYWRYGCEQVAAKCRDLGIPLVIVAGDGRPDGRLAAYSTVSAEDQIALAALLDAGGQVNFRAAINGLIHRAGDPNFSFAAPAPVEASGIYKSLRPSLTPILGKAVIVFYSSFLHAGDMAGIDALLAASARHGLETTAVFVPSLKAPDAAAWLRAELARLAPDVIINATAFSASDGASGSPLDVADCTVLQVISAQSSLEGWQLSARGLSAADMAMHVALPELDGRIAASIISFKRPSETQASLGFAPVLHHPHDDGVSHAAELAAAWARLRRKRESERRVALVLSTYPGRPDQIAHAIGLDGPASAAQLLGALHAHRYDIGDAPRSARDLLDALTGHASTWWPLERYLEAFATLPETFRVAVTAAWGEPTDDPAVRDAHVELNIRSYGGLHIGLQPERGDAGDRKSGYHDPATPPRHAYVAFYLWLRTFAAVDALIHLGAHGTLEWLPGKAAAPAADCAPRALLGAVPCIYPFIVNDPGEAAQAKRRIGAITIGHKTPPLMTAPLDGPLLEIERLVDEFSSADGFDPRRRDQLAKAIADAITRAGLETACGLTADLSMPERLARIDAFLCDVKELSIRDGLHILDDVEVAAVLRALDGQRIAPGPSGAPSRGRSDVLPTGRNLFGIDPRGVPTQTAMANGERAARAIIDRYAEDHGEWPQALVLDLWGSATLRTGGEEFATAFALLGVKPLWDSNSFRVSGFEVVPLALLGRPRVDVTLRISGLFRDMFPTQITLFDAAVHRVAKLREDASENPLAHAMKQGRSVTRVFGASEGSYGAGVMARIDRSDWSTPEDLGHEYLRQSSTAYYGDDTAKRQDADFADRVRDADAFVHMQDHAETDLLTGADFAAHEGGFAAAARALGNAKIALYHGDTSAAASPKIRTLEEECARIVHGRATNERWIAGQMRHGYRGAAEFAATVDAAFAFAATSGAVSSAAFERLYDAYVSDAEVANFIKRENPAAFDALIARFAEAKQRGLWQPRRNDLTQMLSVDRMEAAQ